VGFREMRCEERRWRELAQNRPSVGFISVVEPSRFTTVELTDWLVTRLNEETSNKNLIETNLQCFNKWTILCECVC
jgi:hypothetical protein